MADYNNEMGAAIDFDGGAIDFDGESKFTLIPEGEYAFTVLDFKRSMFNGSAKMAPCTKVTLTLRIEGAAGETLGNVETNIFLNTKCFNLPGFFRAIGQKKHGEKLVPRWNDVPGSGGRCKIKIRTYTGRDGQERKMNDVERFCDPSDNATDFPCAVPPANTQPEW